MLAAGTKPASVNVTRPLRNISFGGTVSGDDDSL